MSANLPLQIGITGGIGAGKSIVTRIFAALGVPVYYMDDSAKTIMTGDQVVIDQVSSLFGSEAYHTDGSLNRQHISAQAFHKPELLAKLNGIVHPAVRRDYESWVQTKSEHVYVLNEAALMFETGSYKRLDAVIIVTAPEQIRIDRVLKRDIHRNREDVLAIIKNQMAEDEKRQIANHFIMNDGSISLIEQVLKLHQHFLKSQAV